jgi:flagellar biosynthesis/type III secretory pathway chaperone
MTEIANLISVLNAEVDLYKTLLSLLEEEVTAIIKWKIDEINEISKRKCIIYCKENILEEARKSFLEQIGKKYNIEDPVNIKKIINVLDNAELKSELENTGKNLLSILEKLQLENTKVKILYKNNMKIIDEFFCDLGIKEYPTYTKGKKMNSADNFTFIKSI